MKITGRKNSTIGTVSFGGRAAAFFSAAATAVTSSPRPGANAIDVLANDDDGEATWYRVDLFRVRILPGTYRFALQVDELHVFLYSDSPDNGVQPLDGIHPSTSTTTWRRGSDSSSSVFASPLTISVSLAPGAAPADGMPWASGMR